MTLIFILGFAWGFIYGTIAKGIFQAIRSRTK